MFQKRRGNHARILEWILLRPPNLRSVVFGSGQLPNPLLLLRGPRELLLLSSHPALHTPLQKFWPPNSGIVFLPRIPSLSQFLLCPQTRMAGKSDRAGFLGKQSGLHQH